MTAPGDRQLWTGLASATQSGNQDLARPLSLMEGRDGNWAGHDAQGRVLRVRRAKDGSRSRPPFSHTPATGRA